MKTAGGHRRAPWAIAIAMVAVALALTVTVLPGGLAAAEPPALASRAKSVGIDGFAFRPGTLTVPRRARVSFVNSDRVAHTATRAGSFDTGRIRPGRSASVRFNRRGTFAYRCTIHPFMKGRIVVQ